MKSMTSYSRQSFLLIIFFMVLLTVAVAAAVYYARPLCIQQLTDMVTPDMSGMELIEKISPQLVLYGNYLLYLVAGVFFITGLLLWLFLRGMAKGLTETALQPQAKGVAPSPVKEAKKPAEPKAERDPRQAERLYLHLLTVLQREGRLVDFLREDLAMYEDDQIGAAVRSIHAGCRKVLDKDLAMAPILENAEGEEISVEAGFNPDAIKLTGRVTGEPPFTGVVRHKGWQTKRVELPELSGAKDASIIAPAEVEIG